MSSYYLRSESDRSEVDVQGGELTVGRAETNQLVLTKGHPSRQHARIWEEGGSLWVEDLGSANGTFVNEQELTEKRALVLGDVVKFDVDAYAIASREAADDGATVVRPAIDSSATVVRPPEPAPEAAPEPTPPPSEPPPPPREPATGAGATPASWENDGSTVALTPEQLAEIRNQLPGAGAEVTSDRPQLQILSGSRQDEVIDLDGDPAEWVIGSGSDAAIVFSDANVSAEQAVLSVEGGRWKISDSISKNKTFVNGQNTPVSYLGSGDVIAFGAVQCRLALPASAKRPAPAAPTSAAAVKQGKSNTTAIAVGGFVVTALVLGGLVFFLG